MALLQTHCRQKEDTNPTCATQPYLTLFHLPDLSFRMHLRLFSLCNLGGAYLKSLFHL